MDEYVVKIFLDEPKKVLSLSLFFCRSDFKTFFKLGGEAQVLLNGRSQKCLDDETPREKKEKSSQILNGDVTRIFFQHPL